ncbi:cupin domain-containing protein [Deinococcus frigens]|uniref:cupin domain-containing protein n=1 Tax=Deinococcus frigens TaxID=249403 RepID=UPI000689809C|nr:cupin domain-containing protein [Deinococcus frigens]
MNVQKGHDLQATNPHGVTLGEARDQLGLPGALAFAEVFRRGTLRAELYAPRGHDPQTPHLQDEVHVVATGNGTYLCEDQRRPFGPGDFLFVAAGQDHRFEDFSGDFAVWVIFYGPEGGEQPGSRTVLGQTHGEGA